MHTHVEGIILQSIPFQNQDRILKVFTKQKGFVSLIMKKVSPKQPEKISLSSSFALAEIVYKEGKKGLHLFEEGKLLNSHLSLREDFSRIEAAWDMGKVISRLALSERALPGIYSLFLSYLQKISLFSNPKILSMSFLLKSLLHEGLFHLKSSCSLCTSPATNLYQGESFCLSHAPELSFFLSEENYPLLFPLTFSRKFSELQTLSLDEKLYQELYDFLIREFP